MKAKDLIFELSKLLGEYPLHITAVSIDGWEKVFHIESKDDIRNVIQKIGLRKCGMTVDRPVGVNREKRGYLFNMGRYYKLSPNEVRESFSYDAETGESIDVPDDFIFC
jgi:hypothetical protein